MAIDVVLLAHRPKWHSRGSGIAKLSSSHRDTSRCQLRADSRSWRSLHSTTFAHPGRGRDFRPRCNAERCVCTYDVLARYRMRRFYRGLGWQWLLMHPWEILPRVGSYVVDRRQYQINPRLHAFNIQMHSESRYNILYVLCDYRITSRIF